MHGAGDIHHEDVLARHQLFSSNLLRRCDQRQEEILLGTAGEQHAAGKIVAAELVLENEVTIVGAALLGQLDARLARPLLAYRQTVAGRLDRTERHR